MPSIVGWSSDAIAAGNISNNSSSPSRISQWSVSNLAATGIVQLELPLEFDDEGRRPGTKTGLARARADRVVDAIRKRFGEHAIDYGCASSVARSVPDEFRRLADREL